MRTSGESERVYERGKEIIPAPPRPPGWESEVDAMGEVGFDALGYTLWRALRAAWLWVDAEPESRAELFVQGSPEAAERLAYAVAAAPELTDALGVFGLVLRSPTLVENIQLARACHEVYEWATHRALVRMAMYFAESAGRADPEDPGRCRIAGRACRRAGEFVRAREWYELGFRIAKRGRKRKLINVAVRCLLGLGGVLQMQGRLTEALPYYRTAVSRARRRDRRALAAESHHDLFLLLSELGAYDEAEEHAAGAVEYYGPRHPRFPYAVHDFTFLLLRRGYFRYALELLDQLAAHFKAPADLALISSTQAWAAAAAQRPERFAVAEERTLRLAAFAEEHAPAVLIHLAEGARALSQWEKADRYAVESVKAARERKDAAIEAEAEALRGAIADHEPGTPAADPPGDTLPNLVARYAARLRRWKGSRTGGPGPPAP